MGKYLAALGVWKHKIGNIEHSLKPRMGDNDKLSSIIRAYQKDKDIAAMYKNMRDLYVEFVIRDYPTIQGEELKELQLWAEMNQNTIQEELLIAYKWQTREDMVKQKAAVLNNVGDAAKNLM